jgi:hypothetical protein
MLYSSFGLHRPSLCAESGITASYSATAIRKWRMKGMDTVDYIHRISYIQIIMFLEFPLCLAGTVNAAEGGTGCINDFVVIPNPMVPQADIAINPSLGNTDRFCGNGFVTLTSKFPVCYIE